ncbi:HutD family protein [Sphingomonas carotinifaciens]|uniref:HutD family protein n=1 Tax=Sphingomonas carotinifaciens TaxID=1166323 RepID=A0A1G7Q0P9_9SPHN|nr:HutD family protein [Sphingomonas carotinifaciens]MBB4087585.1 hypothetical protein [Sphingomonas carotinifaciens]MWC45669.1 HutD family protein [Sphingomonas carotinifaciens]SDF92033.1 hypothetical protein SAMN05216557_107158 [Sphingomonas carotinifaciens]
MKTPRLLRAADRVAQPWRNGGGITREICCAPAAGAGESFDWRVSMAEVTGSGPFSCFPGVDRVLVVLDGRLDLDFGPQHAPVTLSSSCAPFAFAGDQAVDGSAPEGVVHDLNVMVRRDAFAAKVERVSSTVNVPENGTVLLFAGEAATVDCGDSRYHLGLCDALLLSNGGTLHLKHREGANVLLVTIVATDQPVAS